MTFSRLLKSTTALVGTLLILANSAASSAQASPGEYEGKQDRSTSGRVNLALERKIDLLRQKVKYVFVIYHENESFDHYFGTYPGANGLFNAPDGTPSASATSSFVQQYVDTSLTTITISPFLMPQAVKTSAGQIVPIYPADEISVDHSHQGMSNSLDIDPNTGIAANDRYAMDQEGLTTDGSGNMVTAKGVAATAISLAQKQKAEADVGHIDCDTIPFMWHWAKNFVLFDNFRRCIT